jgi:class I fructose-bisphosphate aldolase
MGGQETLYAVEYAARVANELGADIVKVNLPKCDEGRLKTPKQYAEIEWDNNSDADVTKITQRVVAAAGRALVLFSGGSKLGDDDLLAKAHACMAGGATGLIFGRNMWQREWSAALAMTQRIKAVMSEYAG